MENKLFFSSFKNINYDISYIFGNINDLTENQLKQIIKWQHSSIFNYDLFYGVKRDEVQELFLNLKFLRCLNDIAGALTLYNEEIICINKIVFDFMSYNKNLHNELNIERYNLLTNIAYQINNIRINSLTRFFDLETSRFLSILYYSSFDKKESIYRVNYFLYNKCDPEVSEFTLKELFTTLYFTEVFNLFIVTMLDSNIENPVRKKIINVVLDMLEDREYDFIRNTIYNYGYIINNTNVDSYLLISKVNVTRKKISMAVNEVLEIYSDIISEL